MKKTMLVGTTGSGKTTLKQALFGEELKYLKTQALEYCGRVLDTPGEYIESPRFYNILMTSATDYEVVALVHDSSTSSCSFPPNFTSMFNRDVIGIITKTDTDISNPSYSRRVLENAGVKTIFEISSVSGNGLDELKKFLH